MLTSGKKEVGARCSSPTSTDAELLKGSGRLIIMLLLLLREKDETPDIEDLGSVLRNSSIQKAYNKLCNKLLGSLTLCIRFMGSHSRTIGNVPAQEY